jgi:hypothetical protein
MDTQKFMNEGGITLFCTERWEGNRVGIGASFWPVD